MTNDRVSPIRYREIQPRPPLSRYVECFWLLEGDPPVGGLPAQTILPDGSIELVLNFAAPFRHWTEAGPIRQPHRMLVGQMERYVKIQPLGRVEVVGIRFHPTGAYPLLRIPLHELTGGMFRLDEVARRLDHVLSVGVGDERSMPMRIAQVENLLLRELSGFGECEAGIEAAVDLILRRAGGVRVQEVARAMGLSTRQLERRFLHQVGVPPKLFSRLIRFQKVFQAVEGEGNWAAIAAECGYYDSAHLIKDFREFSGQTPACLFQEETLLTHLFTRKNRRSHPYNTTI